MVGLRPNAGGTYYGLGVGSGALLSLQSNASGLPAAVYSPLQLLNVLGVYGRDFGSYRVEGVVRAGPQWGASIHIDLPLR